MRQNNQHAALVIGILRPSRRVLLIRQYRPPVQAFVLEFPAGLINPGESPEQTAVRELKEETGYTGTILSSTGLAASSAGMTGEMVDLFTMDIDESLPENQCPVRALDEGEELDVVLVPLSQLHDFLRTCQAAGICIDSRLAAWAAAQQERLS